MSSVPGRAGGEPAVLGDDLDAADRGVVGGGVEEHLAHRLAGELLDGELGHRQQPLLLLGRDRRVDAAVDGRAEATGERFVVLARVLAGLGGDLGGQQRHQDPVLVGRPRAAVAAQERGAGALLPAEAERAVEQAVDEPLEADRHLVEAAAEVVGDEIDHGARHERLAHAGLRPVARSAEQVVDRDGEVVVRVQQARVRRDDPVAVGVRVAGDRDVEAVAQLEQPRHHVRRGAVHADLAVVVERGRSGRSGRPRR